MVLRATSTCILGKRRGVDEPSFVFFGAHSIGDFRACEGSAAVVIDTNDVAVSNVLLPAGKIHGDFAVFQALESPRRARVQSHR
jgi:hypothetical protein